MAEHGMKDARRTVRKVGGSHTLPDGHKVGARDPRFNVNRTKGRPPAAAKAPTPPVVDEPTPEPPTKTGGKPAAEKPKATKGRKRKETK